MDKPSLASVLGAGAPAAGGAAPAMSLHTTAREVLEAVKTQKELEGAALVVRSAMGPAADPVEQAGRLMAKGAELAGVADARQAEAQARQAEAEVKRLEVEKTGELKAKELDHHRETSAVDAAVKVAELLRPQQPAAPGLTLEGVAALIAALRPADAGTGVDKLVAEMRHQQDLLLQEIRHLREQPRTGPGASLTETLEIMERLSKVTGTHPEHSLQMRKLDIEERLGLHEIREKEATRRAQAEEQGQLVGMVRDVVQARPWERHDAPAQQGAPPATTATIRCGACNRPFPGELGPDGQPLPRYTCPHCGAEVGR